MHSPFVYVRELPETSARRLGYKWPGEVIVVSDERDGWLKLAHEDGWMLRDGSALGLGELLRDCDGGAAGEAGGALCRGSPAPVGGEEGSERPDATAQALVRKMVERVRDTRRTRPAASRPLHL